MTNRFSAASCSHQHVISTEVSVVIAGGNRRAVTDGVSNEKSSSFSVHLFFCGNFVLFEKITAKYKSNFVIVPISVSFARRFAT